MLDDTTMCIVVAADIGCSEEEGVEPLQVPIFTGFYTTSHRYSCLASGTQVCIDESTVLFFDQDAVPRPICL